MATLTTKEQVVVQHLYESGKSARQIAEHFEVSLGAVFYVLRRRNVVRRSSRESNKLLFEAKSPSYSLKRNLSAENEQLKLAAVMLYWAEGYKTESAQGIDFANSDPAMAQLFIKFLVDICGVTKNRIRCFLYCYEGQDIEKLLAYWSGTLEVPTTQFTRPYVKKVHSHGVRGARMKHGLVHIRYCDKKLLLQILRWIDEYKHKCVGTQVVNEGTL